MPACPAYDIRPSRSFTSENWRETRSSQTAKSWLHLKFSIVGANLSTSIAVRVANAGDSV
jgi:hypothetical protein